jgi:hypothetical protein
VTFLSVHLTLLSTVETANIIRWYKKEGDFVNYKDLLCDIETEVSSIYSFSHMLRGTTSLVFRPVIFRTSLLVW